MMLTWCSAKMARIRIITMTQETSSKYGKGI